MGLIATFVLGVFLGALIPSSYKSAAGRLGRAARDAVVGHAPAPAIAPQPGISLHVALGNIFGFFWKWRTPLLLLAVFLLVVGFMRGCSFRPWQTADDLRVEMAESETKAQDKIINRNAELAEISQNVAVLRAQLDAISQQGHEAIANATPDDEAPIDPAVSAAWRQSIGSLRLYPGANTPSSDPN